MEGTIPPSLPQPQTLYYIRVRLLPILAHAELNILRKTGQIKQQISHILGDAASVELAINKSVNIWKTQSVIVLPPYNFKDLGGDQ